MYIEDSEISEGTLIETVSKLVSDNEYLKNLQSKSLSMAHFDGTEKIVEQLKNIVKNKT